MKKTFDNNTYNLLMELTQEHKKIWRIKNEYKSDSAGDQECHQFWEKLEKQCDENINKLEELLTKRMP